MINGIEIHTLEAKKYWSFAKPYKSNPQTETHNII